MKYKHSKNNSGQAMLIAVLFFLFISLAIVIGIASPILQQVKISNDLVRSDTGYYMSEGALEDAIYRIKNNDTIASGETLSLNGSSATITLTPTSNGTTVDTSSNIKGDVRGMESQLTEGTGANFAYGVQAGTGGLSLSGGSSIKGNAYSNGSITATDGPSITGSATAVDEIGGGSGPWGMSVGSGGVGDAWAHTVVGVTVAGNLYCQSSSGTNKTMGCDTTRADPAIIPMPLASGDIENWENEAPATSTGLIYNGNLTISTGTTTTSLGEINGDLNVNGNGDTIIGGSGLIVNGNVEVTGSTLLKVGPMKVNGNLDIQSSMTITGTIWVTGTVTIESGATVALDASYGANSGVIVSNGYVIITGGSTLKGSGQSSSYLMFATDSGCPTTGSCGGNDAISLTGGSGAVVLDAQNGTIDMVGGTAAEALAATQIILSGGATLTYNSGLANLNFSNGSLGGWQISTWQEVQ